MEITVDRRLRHWWVFLIRGLIFILLGIYMIARPASGFAALGFLLGLMILLAGVSELLHVVRDRSAFNRGWHLFIGIIDIILGLILVSHVWASATILRIIVGIWFLFRGISLLSFSGLLRRSWLMIAGGIIVIIFALMVLFNPVFGAMTVVLWTALALIITGVFNVMLAIWMKRLE
ncbi:MAG: DUF308 domain-containing protein [Bacteroidetes bacterium]|nr:DUF308 domain-containing protein [Bacteroidota bacterium]